MPWVTNEAEIVLHQEGVWVFWWLWRFLLKVARLIYLHFRVFRSCYLLLQLKLIALRPWNLYLLIEVVVLQVLWSYRARLYNEKLPLLLEAEFFCRIGVNCAAWILWVRDFIYLSFLISRTLFQLFLLIGLSWLCLLGEQVLVSVLHSWKLI